MFRPQFACRSFRSTPRSVALCFAIGTAAGVSSASAGPTDVIGSGTAAWAAAARTGRSDMLILGDSVTWFGGHGWDAGISEAAANTVGLAGTGLMGDAGTTGQGYDGYNTFGAAFWNNGYDTTLSAIPASRQGYALRTGVPAVSAGSTAASGFGWTLYGSSMKPGAAYDWSLYTAAGPGGGSLGAYRRLAVADDKYFFNVVESKSGVATALPANGLGKTVLSFAPVSYPQDLPEEIRLTDVTNTSILYSRLSTPGAKGVTVSSLGYGGHGTKDFYNDILNSMSADGRSAYLSALVDGGGGKLNIMIAQGFNDRNDRTLSLHGAGTGDSAAGFRDNLSSLIALLRSGWAASGFKAADLSFTLVGTYQDSSAVTGIDGVTNPLLTFAEVERELAALDPQLSFVDLWADAADYNTAVTAGYLADSVHPTALGSTAYSAAVFNAITATPEPATLGGVLLAGVLLGRRSRRTRTA